MGWQTQVAVQLRAGNTIINPNGTFVYSSAPAAGNLIATQTPTAGTDQYGNHYLAGTSTYSSTFAATLQSGFVAFYLGSLASGWSLGPSVSSDAVGNLQVDSNAGLQLVGSAGVAISGAVTVNSSSATQGPNGTGFFNTQGLASGSYGSTHQHTLPNFPTATHTHNYS